MSVYKVIMSVAWVINVYQTERPTWKHSPIVLNFHPTWKGKKPLKSKNGKPNTLRWYDLATYGDALQLTNENNLTFISRYHDLGTCLKFASISFFFLFLI